MEPEADRAEMEVDNFRESVAYIFQDWVGQGMDLDYDQAVQRIQRLAGRALAGHEEGWGQQEQQTWAQDAGAELENLELVAKERGHLARSLGDRSWKEWVDHSF